jgi:hypothetical protein
MPSRPLSPTPAMLRDPAVLLVLMAVISVQLLAFYVVCSQQMQKAEERQSVARAERVATIDCLETLSQMTFASCALRSAKRQGSAVPNMMGAAGHAGSTVPAAYVLR